MADDGNDAFVGLEAAWQRSEMVNTAASHGREGLYFINLVPSSIDDPGLDLAVTMETLFYAGMHPGNLVFKIMESDLARDPAHALRIRKYLDRRGFGFALNTAGFGAGAYSFQAVSDFAPNYISLDARLIRNIDRGGTSCAPAISKLIHMGEKCGACVIAEGVDRLRTVENLWLLGVQFMQGQLFGDPLPYSG